MPAAVKKPKFPKSAAPDPRAVKALESRFQEGKAFERTAKYGEAEKIYREILARAEQLHFTTAHVCVALGYALLMQAKYEDAERYLLRAQRLDPNLLEVHINLGAVYRMQERWKESEKSCKRALEIEPKDTRARLNLGFVQEKIQEYGQAVQSFLLVLSLDPDNIEARKGLASTYVALGDTDVCIPLFRKVLEMDPESWQLRSGMLFAMQYDPTVPNEKVLEEHLEFGRQVREHAGPAKPRSEFSNPRNADRKLKIGYLSADFRGHVVMKFAEEVITSHNKDRFEVFCITPHPGEDETTRRIRSKVDHWRDITGIEDIDAAGLLRSDELDIIVDLMGHSSVQRLPLLGRRVAPVQISWCGYSGTTGVDTVDHIIVDDIIAPPGERVFFVEEPIRLPHSYVSFTPRNFPEIRPLPFDRNGYITFGCMNNPSKVNKYVLSWWAQILKAVPHSRILMRYHLLGDPLVDERLARVFRNAGIPPERLDMRSGGHDFLSAYNEVDIALDSFPYNGTTTTCEALWMGVPVITLRGDRFVARVGASLLTNTGMSDLIAENPKEYIEKAIALADDPERLMRFRDEAREILPTTPVYNPKGFVKHLEQAYVGAFERWCNEAR
jgi:predicted O-linked N-acetylglucosamine transferase (SPINDLY family)